jgi:4'-phosphopantetheinyl transferase
VLPADERSRAGRFRFESDKKRFVAARAFLRIILGRYLQINPLAIRFEYNKYGKPSISRELNREIKFNLSHSENTALVAVAKAREIGVDIERTKSSFVDEAMAFECLTTLEIERFQMLSGSEQAGFFFNCWTRKEAYIKACGRGLSLSPNQIEAFPISGFLTSLTDSNSESRQIVWSLQQLPSITGYAAALAIEGEKPGLRFWSQPNAELFC